jgi:hypothetical protein
LDQGIPDNETLLFSLSSVLCLLSLSATQGKYTNARDKPGPVGLQGKVIYSGCDAAVDFCFDKTNLLRIEDTFSRNKGFFAFL